MIRRILCFALLVLIGSNSYAQCLTNTLTVNTGYNPITNTAIAPGTNGGVPVPDALWIITAMSAGTSAAIAGTGGLTPVVPGNKADVVQPVGGAWVANPAGNPGGWINCVNSNTYTDPANGVPLTITFGRPFRLCTADSVRVTIFVASDNSSPAVNIDGTMTLPAPATGFNAYTPYTQTVYLTAGTHTFNIVVSNQNLVSPGSNPTGLNVYGTFSSATGVNSLVSESYASCASYNCTNTCNTISLPDSVHLCQGEKDTFRAVIVGTLPVLSRTWTPVTGLSSSTVLRPEFTAGTTSGYYYLTIQSQIPYNLVYNGDFSLGNTGFSSSYGYVSGTNSLQPESRYAITTNPLNVHNSAASFGDHTTGTGNMMVINGSSTPTSFWCQTIPVTPNTDYAFSAWVANWSAPGAGQAPILQFQLNSVLIGTPLTLTNAPGVWVNFYAIWNSGANTSANICIYDACTALGGNDFVIDDISFQELCVARDSIYADVHLIDTTYTHKDTNVCITALTAVTLTAPPGHTSYRWSTGSTASSIVVSGAGNYVLYAGGNCAMLIDTFKVLPVPLDSTFTHKDTSVCARTTNVTLTAPPGYTAHQWSTGSTASNINVTAAGDYILYARVNCDLLVDTFHFSFDSIPPPPSVRDTMYCKNYGAPAQLQVQVSNYTGTLGLFDAAGPQIPTNFTPSTAVADYPLGHSWLANQTVDGCPSDSVPVKVTIIPLPDFTINTRPWVCQFDSMVLAYQGQPLVGGTFQWTLPAGAVFTNDSKPTDSMVHVRFDTANKNTMVYLKASNLHGQCDTTVGVNIDVVELPSARSSTKEMVCMNDTVMLALSAKSATAQSFTWFIDNIPMTNSGALNILSGNTNTGGPFTISWVDSGMHIINLQAYAAHGCTNKPKNDTVMVRPIPNAWIYYRYVNDKASLNPPVCLDDSIEVFSGGTSAYDNHYLWQPEHYFASGQNGRWSAIGRVEQNPSVIKLTVTDPFGCEAVTQQTIKPEACCMLNFPSAFSPNGDGHNDIFRPITISPGGIKQNHFVRFHYLRIANRWGQVVYSSSNNMAGKDNGYNMPAYDISSMGWDGTLSGIPQEIGVYYYVAKYDCDGKLIEQKGDVTLVR